MVERFNIRVYGLLLHAGKVLITDENRAGMIMTKFPGGGLEKGEGIADCLIREFREELSIAIQVSAFFYVNDFLQLSAFDKKEQLISMYYFVKTEELDRIPLPVEINELNPNEQGFRWVKLGDLKLEKFTFPIDRHVAGLLDLQA